MDGRPVRRTDIANRHCQGKLKNPEFASPFIANQLRLFFVDDFYEVHIFK